MRNFPNMRNIQIIIQILIALPAFGQLGEGIVRFAFDENTRIDFYTDTSDSSPERLIQFFFDESTRSYNIRDIEIKKEWLNPQAIWLDYDFFFFRCIQQTDNFYKVVTNNQTGLAYWVKKADFITYQNWEQFLLGVLTISRNTDQDIKLEPDSDSPKIDFIAEDCFHVVKMKGDWIEITTNGICKDEDLTTGKLTSGWIRWREGEKLLIDYFLIM